MGQQKGSRAIGALGLPRLQATLPDKRRLLIAGHSGDRNAVGKIIQSPGDTEISRAGANRRQ